MYVKERNQAVQLWSNIGDILITSTKDRAGCPKGFLNSIPRFDSTRDISFTVMHLLIFLMFTLGIDSKDVTSCTFYLTRPTQSSQHNINNFMIFSSFKGSYGERHILKDWSQDLLNDIRSIRIRKINFWRSALSDCLSSSSESQTNNNMLVKDCATCFPIYS